MLEHYDITYYYHVYCILTSCVLCIIGPAEQPKLSPSEFLFAIATAIQQRATATWQWVRHSWETFNRRRKIPLSKNRTQWYWNILTDCIFCTRVSSLTAYFILEYSYWLYILYWNILTLRILISLLTC